MHALKRQCLNHGWNRYHNNQALSRILEGQSGECFSKRVPQWRVWGSFSKAAAQGKWLHALWGRLRLQWLMTPCLACLGWLHQATGALIILIQRWLFVVWQPPQPQPTPLSCRRCTEAFVMWGESVAGKVISLPCRLSQSCLSEGLQECMNTHSLACGGGWLNGFCLWVMVVSEGILYGCKKLCIWHSLPLPSLTAWLYFCCCGESMSSSRACAEVVFCLKNKLLGVPLSLNQCNIGAKAGVTSWPFEMGRTFPGNRSSGSLPASWSQCFPDASNKNSQSMFKVHIP